MHHVENLLLFLKVVFVFVQEITFIQASTLDAVNKIYGIPHVVSHSDSLSIGLILNLTIVSTVFNLLF